MPRAKKMQTTGGQYGEQAALDRAQDAVPALNDGPVPIGPAAEPAFIGPDEVPNLADPTSRPGEPVTQGMPFGPGDGPLPGQEPGEDPTLQTLRALYAKYPSTHLRRMIQRAGG